MYVDNGINLFLSGGNFLANLRSLLSVKSSIRNKFIAISFLLLSIPLILTGTFAYKKSTASLDALGEDNLKSSVEMTIEFINVLNAEVENGHLSLEDAQEKVKELLLDKKDQDGIRALNPNIDLGENGYIFILDDTGTLLLHPSAEGKNNWDSTDPNGFLSTQAIIKTAGKGGGLTYFDWTLPNDDSRIGSKVAYSNRDPHWGWNIAAGTYTMDFNKPAQQILNLVLLVAGSSLLIGTIIIWIFANYISKPIRMVTDHMDHLANGDLSQDTIQIHTKDEVGQLAQAMNQMKDSLKEMLKNVSDASITLSDQSTSFTRTALEVNEGGEQIALTMNELAIGSETQAHNATNLTEMMNTFNVKIVEANYSGEEIYNSSNHALSMTIDGKTLMDQYVEQMENIHEKVQFAVESVKELNRETNEIPQLVQVIKGIAEQTNLLSLNAAIEAARAGEQGKGFAVVAAEVRKLAEQVSNSVGEITAIVERVLNGSEQAATALQSSFEEVDNGTEQIRITGVTFENINQSVTEVVGKVQTISLTLQDLAKNSHIMNQSFEEISAVAEESAAGIEEVAASALQSSSSMMEITNDAENLSELAERLDSQVSSFKL